MTADLTVVACQFEPTVGDVDANYARIESSLADDPDADLVVFPELCVTGYDLSVARETATPVPGPLTDPAVELAAEYECALVVGVPERDGDRLYNSLVYVDETGVRESYRKRHLWGSEADVFRSGSGPRTVDTPWGTLGLLVCYDLNFPERAVEYARAECDLLVVSAAWRDSYLTDWDLLLRARAFDGTCFVVGSNHCGAQNGRSHAGHSAVVDPTGSVVARAGSDSACVTATVDRETIASARERNPVLESRRS